jgi:carbon monoxide dehydrogenase subunit G
VTIELEQWVRAPVDAVYAVLSDPSQLAVLHPLIEQVTVTFRDAARVEVELFEHVPFGPFKVPNRYQASYWFQPEAPRKLRMRGVSAPKVVVSTEFTLEPVNDGTRVVERLEVTALFGLQGFVTKTAVAAHRQQLENLAKHFAR